MGLTERAYSILIVSPSEAFAQTMRDLFLSMPFACAPVRTVRDCSAADRELFERAYDFVIVYASSSPDGGMRFASDASEKTGSAVMSLVRGEIYDEQFDRAVAHGVFLLRSPTAKSTLHTAICWLASAREQRKKNESSAQSLEEKMAEIRLVNRAKWLLISQRGMDEPEAHRFIEKSAMDRCVTRRRIAEEILASGKKQGSV